MSSSFPPTFPPAQPGFPPTPPSPPFPPLPPPPSPPKKSRARWIVPLALLFLFVAFLGGLGLLLLGTLAAGGGTDVPTGAVLELALRDGFRDSPDPVAALLPGLAGPPSLYELRKATERAAADSEISGLALDVNGLGVGWGEAAELVAMIDRFRASGKPVHAYLGGEFVSDLDYAVACSADRVWMAPLTTLAVNGLQAEIEFWKGTLDKLHIEPQFFQRREYKTAAESYSRTELSEASREATSVLLADIWDNFLSDVGRRRKLEPDSVRASADLGLMNANEALAAKWIDGVGYHDSLEGELLKSTGQTRYRGVTVRRYLRHTASQDLFSEGPRLALVFGEGAIVSSPDAGPFDDSLHGPAVASAIRKAADDTRIKGILFRVNSPGGSAVGSDYVWRAVEYARKEKHKPVVVSMSSMAASGGYWIAMNSDAIVATPATMTGSIGVVFGKLNVLGLYQLAGANVDTVTVGRNAGILSGVTSFNEEQRGRVDAWLDHTYGEFKSRVAAGRNLDAEKVEEVARGRVWSGLRAKELGLVDALGGYDEALTILREKAGLAKDAKVDLEIYPRQKTLFEALFSEDEPTLNTETLRAFTDPERAVRKALSELTVPGAWLMMTPVQVR